MQQWACHTKPHLQLNLREQRGRSTVLHHVRHLGERAAADQLRRGGATAPAYSLRRRRVPDTSGGAERRRHMGQRAIERFAVVQGVGTTILQHLHAYRLACRCRRTVHGGLHLCLQAMGKGSHKSQRLPLQKRAHRDVHQRVHLQCRPDICLYLRRLPIDDAGGCRMRRPCVGYHRHTDGTLEHDIVPVVCHHLGCRKQHIQQPAHGQCAVPDIDRCEHRQPLYAASVGLCAYRRAPRGRYSR